MNFAQNFRIRTRMMWLAAVTLISLCILGVVYVVGESLMSRASATADEYNRLETLMQHVEVGALELRRKEKDFFLRQDMKYFEQYNTVAKSTLATLDEGATLSVAAPMVADIKALRAGVESHQAQFAKVTGAYAEAWSHRERGTAG